MEAYKQEFIEFLLKNGALKFGDFTLKSGRQCPYFVNVGAFYNAADYTRFVDFYAQALVENGLDFDTVFGPAYKGIPLCVGIASAYYFRAKKDVNWSFNRKEAKDHGEGGLIVGAPVTADSRLVIVDDVMTAGTALRETMALLKSLGGPHVAGIVIAVDRMERGQGDKSAAAEMKEEFGVNVFSIVSLVDILEHAYGKELEGPGGEKKVWLGDAEKEAIEKYRAEYGV